MKTLHTIFTNFAKRVLMALALITMGVSTAWGEETTRTWNFESVDTQLSNLDKEPISVSYAQNNGTNPVAISSSAFRLYKGSSSSTNGCSVTFTIANGYKIESITVVFKDGRTSARGKIDNGSYEDVFSAGNSKTVTISSLSAQSYSIQNQGSSTVAITSITITYSSNASTPTDPYTVTFHTTATAETELTEESAGDGVTPPTMEEVCGDWTFQGWSKSFSNSETSTTELELVTLDEGIYYPTADVDLYPVYTKTEGGGGAVTWNKVTTAPADWSGEYLIVNSNYAMTSDFYSGTSGEFKGANVTVSNNQVTSSPSDKMIWIVEKNGSNAQYSFKNKSTGTYANITGTNSTNAALSSSVIWFTISSSSTSGVWKINSVSYSARCFSYYSSRNTFRTYANSSNTTGSLYKKEGSGFTTYYYSYPQCTTETTITLHPNGGTISDANWTLENGVYKLTTEDESINLPTITRTGYTFGGWATSSGGTKEHNANATITLDGTPVTLYAIWTANKYNITYKDQGDVAFSGTHEDGYPTQHTYGIETTLKGATKIGYTFEGWHTDATCTNKVTTLGATEYTDAITLYAQWTAKALTNYRTFCDVVCDAYSFHTGSDDDREEWLKEAIKCFTEAEGGYEHEWQIKDYIIPNDDDKFFVGNYGYFYNDNLGIGGANGKSRSVVSDWGNMYLAPAMDENDAQGTPRLGHAKGAKGTLRIFEDSNWDNLFVGFIPDGYKLKFGNEEYTFAKTTGTEYRSEAVVEYNSTNADKNVSVGVVDADGNYVATNHTQEMRHIFLNTGGTSYWEADNVDNFALYDITNETFTCLMHKTGYPNIYEGWVPTTCAKIIFVRLKSSTINWNNMHNQTVDITLDAAKNLYTINNWNQEDNKSGGTWSVYERYGQFAMHDNSKSKNWYVHFVPHYVLTYDKNADDATGTMDIQTVAVDAANKGVVVADCGFTRHGYEFIKWRKGTTSTYYVPNGSNTIDLNADIILYAQWQAKNITITWDANGGSVNPTTSTYTYNGTPVELPIPARANYIFNGWFTATTGGTKITEVGTTNKPTEDVTYYAQWTEKATPTFAWSAATCTAALEADNTFPTLSNPDNLSVTYKSSDENVAKIDVNGNIILGAVGTTTITADGAETATHKSATTTYELTVVDSNCKWVEVEIGDIDENDQVVIAMAKTDGTKTWALDNSATGTYPAAGALLVEGNKISQPLDKYIWNIVATPEGYVLYSYADKTTWLYCTGSNNTVKVGTGSDKKFVIENGYLKCSNQLTVSGQLVDAYIGVSSSTNSWRHYPNTTGVIKDQTLKFYKRECLDSEHYWVEGNLTNVTCTPQLPQIIAKDGDPITLTFEAADGYTLPTSVSVKMGSTTLTPSWNRTTGELTINAPTGGFTDNVLVTVEALQVKTVTFSVGNGDTAPAEMQAEENTDITLPAFTTNLTCVNFVGWTDAASGYTHGTDKLYKAGDSYTVTENVTLHAVYAAGGGYVLVTDVANLAVGDKVIIVNTDASVAMGGQNENNRAQVEVEIVDNTISNIGESQILTLEAGKTSGTFALYTGDGYLYAAGGSGDNGKNYLKTTPTLDNKGSWNISISNNVATIKSVEPTGTKARNWLRYNSGSYIFSCYASGQADVSIYKESITGYTTDPECVMYNVTLCTPTNGTISVDKTIVDPYGSTILTFAPAAGYMLDAVTITSGTAEVGTVSYTSNQTSGGTVKISNIQSDIVVCATFKEIPYYKVTFVDMNANPQTSTEVFQSEFGGDITAPTTASDGCDVTWTFIGWAPSNSLNGTTEVPANLVEAGGTISGANITNNNLKYYSVYSNSSDGTPPFSIGKSGTYYFKAITENSDVYYATGEFTGSDRYNTNSTPNIPFLLTYNSTTGKYTIKNTLSDKYLAPDSYEENDLTEQDASYGWDVIQPTLYADKGTNAQAKTGEYLFSYTKSDGTSVRYLYCNGSYFDSWTKDYNKYALYLEPASEMRYYNASSCTELVTMTFDVLADAELTYENGYPEGYYKDSEKKNVSTFPTLTYEGWTFIGWTAGASYNDQIGDANLDDENSSPNAPSETIYKTGGVSYYLGADVTMYPVFTKFADNEPFDMVNGGDYYIYYIADGDVATSEDEYGAANRIYAGGWGSGGTSNSYGATQSCASATLFTFTKLSNGKWSIYDNTKGRYLCAGTTDNNLALNTTTATYGEWTITVHNGNQVNAVSRDGYTLSAYSQDAVTGTFKNYATSNFNNNSKYYHRVYVGTCTERVYSSNPSNKPKITLNGTAAVTSTKDQTIRSAKSLTLSAVKLAANGTITLTSDNADVYFSTDKTANFSKAIKPVASLTINADANGKLALTTVYVHYKPAAVPTSNLDIQTVTITATTGTDGQPNYATATTTATVRNLPADFVIAAKVNDIWYALPNNCNSTSIVNGLPIDVDDPINPTSATFAPAEAKWGLKPVYTTSGANDRYADYGEYFVFAETNTGTAGLLYSNKDNAQVQTQGTYSGISGYQEISRYEWIPTTTDLITYQLAGAQDSKQLNINVNGVFGTHSQLIAENELRLLPIVAIYQHAEVQVVEWRADAVVFMYTSDPNHSVTTTLASTSTTKSLSEIKFDHGVYKMPVSNLLSNAGKTMSIKFHDGSTEIARTEITIPIIINGETNTSSLTALAKADYETLDVVILNGGKLTATEGDAAKYRFRNVTVYGGGKLVIGEGKYLSMASIILRAGGFANDGTYEYVYPQFELKGNLTNTAGKFYYDYITDYNHWYHLVLPFAGDLGTIKYPTEFYGSNVTTSNSGSWIIKRYAGDIRATGNYKAWVDIETDNPKPTATTPGVGYIFWGAPKKVKVNGEENRQQWGIQRISMTKGAGTAKDEEKADKTIYNLSSYENVANNSGKDNDQGWNLIGNPYMVNLTDMSTSGLHACKLVPVNDAAGNWTGKWEWNDETNIRYLTIPSEHFDTYTAKTVNQAVPLVAGRAFFVQLEGEANAITFAADNRASLMPALRAANDKPVDIETGIILSNETLQDEVNFWIKDGKTNDYEYNADYPKTPNNNQFNIYGVHTNGDLSWVATGPEYAAESMPIGYQVPAAGTYILSLSEIYNSDGLDALYVTDHALSPEVTVDIMSEPYEFSVNQAETNNERFTVSVRVKAKTENGATGLGNVGADGEQIHKFIYQDKMYILHHGVIYDATGKRVITINK